MAAFTELDWRRFDTSAVVQQCGLGGIDEARAEPCREWLMRQGYTFTNLDGARGLSAIVAELGLLFGWEEKFGYVLGPDDRNLMRLRDGFWFDIPDGGRHVLELTHPELIWKEDPTWLLGLLDIAVAHSRWQLALGRRFFTLIVHPDNSPLVGKAVAETWIPGAYWHPAPAIHHFQ